jgi:hypothetical protein
VITKAQFPFLPELNILRSMPEQIGPIQFAKARFLVWWYLFLMPANCPKTFYSAPENWGEDFVDALNSKEINKEIFTWSS